MSFDELWDGFDKIKDRTEAGEKFTKSIIKYLTKRHEVELRYSKSLEEIFKTCFNQELEIGTTKHCWGALKEETEKLAMERQKHADSLQSLIDQIKAQLQDDKKNRALLVAKGNKLVSELKKNEENMNKARAKYVESRKKQDKSQEAIVKAKAAGRSVTQPQKAAEKDEKKADKADNEYRITVNNLKIGQDKFFEVDMPALLREFEVHEDKRLQSTKNYFGIYVSHDALVGPFTSLANERFDAKVKAIDVSSDLKLYVNENRPTSPNPPPRAQYESYDGKTEPATVGMGTSSSEITKTKSKKESKIPKLVGVKKVGKKEKKPEDKKSTVQMSTSSGFISTPSSPPPVSSPPPFRTTPISPSAETGPPVIVTIPPPPQPEPYHPPASEEVELITIYSYTATEEGELTFAEGEKLVLIEKDDSGWWRGRNLKGDEGVFPMNFVELVGQEGTGSGTVDIDADFKALYDYDAEDETELTIKEGEILHVVSETDGWYFGTNSQGHQGNFPSNFVEPLTANS